MEPVPSRLKILVCLPVIPWPMSDGLRVRIFNLCRELAKRHELHLFCLSRMGPSEEQEQEIAAAGMGLTVVVKPFSTPETKMAAYLSRLVKGVPPELILSWEKIICSRIKELHGRERFDVVVGEHLFMARFILEADCPRVLDEHNVEGDLHRQLAKSQNAPGRWFKYADAVWLGLYERRLLRRMQMVTAVTEADASRFKAMVPGLPVDVVENGVSCIDYAEAAGAPRAPGDSLLYIGLMSYAANSDAVEWFASEILPIVHLRRPGAVLTVAGSDPPESIRNLDDGRTIKVLGFVDDLKPLHQESSIMVVPLLAGGGSRLKILEAFATGTPVVSTTKGAEGLEVQDGRHLLIADEPGDFAAAVVRLSEDDSLYQDLRANARALVEEKYDWPVLARKMEAALIAAAAAGAAS
ncbi:MAG: glycosyltransferase [Actinobacteria bacterium]|nr:glycosyltransferase [Actinomycetota bacterium]